MQFSAKFLYTHISRVNLVFFIFTFLACFSFCPRCDTSKKHNHIENVGGFVFCKGTERSVLGMQCAFPCLLHPIFHFSSSCRWYMTHRLSFAPNHSWIASQPLWTLEYKERKDNTVSMLYTLKATLFDFSIWQQNINECITGGPGIPCSPEIPTSPFAPYERDRQSQNMNQSLYCIFLFFFTMLCNSCQLVKQLTDKMFLAQNA